MTFTKEQVLASCNVIAPALKFDPLLVYAICLQEGARDGDEFDPSVARLEEGFYLRYVEKKNDLATTSEVLLAASYGVMQMMGLSLMELDFFEYYFNLAVVPKEYLGSPLSQVCIVSAIDWYCENLNAQIEWGTKHLAKKRELAENQVGKMLDLWNGDRTGKYRTEVLKRFHDVGGKP
jgi:hypothetical protein